MKSKRQTVFLNEGLEKMLEVIMKNTGSGTIPRTIIFCIQDVYTRKYYNKYTMQKGAGLNPLDSDAPKMTKEQICEYFGGTVGKNEMGARVCHLKKGGLTERALLDLMGTGNYKVTKENKEYYKSLEERKQSIKEKEENGE